MIANLCASSGFNFGLKWHRRYSADRRDLHDYSCEELIRMSQTRYDAVKPLRMTVTSDLESIPKAHVAGEQMALRIGFSAEQARMITLTIDEALANVIQHGYRGVGGKPIHITIRPVCVEGRSGIGILIRDQAEPVDPAPPNLGPYAVESEIWRTPSARLLVARDADLDRRVWIHHYDDPEAGPALDRLRRSTPGRLGWLQGSRTEGESWDAYAMPSGISLPDWVRAKGRLSWVESRQILRGVALELSQPGAEAPPALSPRRVWVDGTGEPKLLDFPVDPTDRGEPTLDPSTTEPADFLRWLAAYSLEGRDEGGPTERPNGVRSPVPGHAHEFLQELFAEDAPSASTVAERLDDLMTEPPTVTRGRRGMAVLLGAFVPLFTASVSLAFAALMYYAPSTLDVFEAENLVEEIQKPDTAVAGPSARRKAAEVLLINLGTISDEDPILSQFLDIMLAGPLTDLTREELKALSDSLAAARPPPTPHEIQEARRVIRASGLIIHAFAHTVPHLTARTGVIAVVLALLLRGGPVLLALGVQVRTADGSRAASPSSTAR